MERSSGILLPLFSLPSPYGIGTMGLAAYDFADLLHAAGQRYWQMLPLGPTSYGDSPYQSFSSYAGNPYLIDLDLLIEDGLLTEQEVCDRDWGEDPRHVDYGKLYENRLDLLKKAAERGWMRDSGAVAGFTEKNASWLLCAVNFSPNDYENYRVGVPPCKRYVPAFTTDAPEFGGSGFADTKPLTVKDTPSHGKEQSVTLRLPAFGAVFLRGEGSFTKRGSATKVKKVKNRKRS